MTLVCICKRGSNNKVISTGVIGLRGKGLNEVIDEECKMAKESKNLVYIASDSKEATTSNTNNDFCSFVTQKRTGINTKRGKTRAISW